MKIFNSAFSRVHMIFALFSGINIFFGFALGFPIPFFRTTAQLHFLAGLLTLSTPFVLLIFLKNRKPVWTAFTVRLSFNKNDFKNKPLILAKIVAWIFISSLLLFVLAGIFIKLGIAAWMYPNRNIFWLHTKGIYLLPPLLILHAVTMTRVYRKRDREVKKIR
ncbi:MAG TPA: hypothetical protein DIT32_07145 [Peptococcaceae bacterium]|nr:hypothetical protein [Peptococcaceae bacterium]